MNSFIFVLFILYSSSKKLRGGVHGSPPSNPILTGRLNGERRIGTRLLSGRCGLGANFFQLAYLFLGNNISQVLKLYHGIISQYNVRTTASLN